MGNSIFRNRFWYYRSLYDDYMFREMRATFFIAGLLWLPFYYWGIHVNRELEVYVSHKNYQIEWGPRRSRLTHSLLFEQFEMDLERWKYLQDKSEPADAEAESESKPEDEAKPDDESA